jgi:hypothetical protein
MMKLTTVVAVLSLVVAAVTADNDGMYVMDIEVDFYCKDMDVGKLSISGKTFLAKAVEESFNSVHQKLDQGDITLTGSHYIGVKKVPVRDDNNSMMIRGQQEGVGKYKKPTLPDVRVMTSYGCRLCRDDDMQILSGGASMKMWESELAAFLVESGKPAFANVHSCDITVHAADDLYEELTE